MGIVKITKIGNSHGVTIPQEILKKGNFRHGDFLEVHFFQGRLILFKKPPHHSKMKFKGAQEQEEIEWAEADFDELKS